MKEYCKRCRAALEEWEWSGRGFCESCEEKIEQESKAAKKKSADSRKSV